MAVPGALKGYWEAHQKYGKLPWSRLFKPAINLCKNGFLVSDYLAKVLASQVSRIHAEPTMAEFLIDPTTNSTWMVGIFLNETCIIFFVRKIIDTFCSYIYLRRLMIR